MLGNTEGKDIQTVVWIVFHEHRLQYMEKEQMVWQAKHQPMDDCKPESMALNTNNSSSPDAEMFTSERTVNECNKC